MSAVGEYIRMVRKQRRLTLDDVGDWVGVSRPYISDIETGRRRGSAGVLQRIAGTLNIDAAVMKHLYAMDAKYEAEQEWDAAARMPSVDV